MYELSTENTKLIAGGYWVYVTPEWKHEQAVVTGAVLGTLSALFGSIVFFSEMSCATLGAPFILGAAGYGIGYGLDRLDSCFLENNTWHNVQLSPVVLYY